MTGWGWVFVKNRVVWKGLTDKTTSEQDLKEEKEKPHKLERRTFQMLNFNKNFLYLMILSSVNMVD